MTQAEALMVVATLGQSIYRRRLLRQSMSGVAVVVVLAFLTALMASVLLVGGVYAVYVVALHYAIAPYVAMIAIGVSTLLALVVFAIATRVALRRLMQRQSPIATQVDGIANAFLNGLLEP